MKKSIVLAVAVLAVGAVAIGTAGAPDASASADVAACAKVPTRYYNSPAAVLWTESCVVGQKLGPRRISLTYHFGTTDPTTVAQRYASREAKLAHPFVQRIGLAKTTRAIYDGVLAGFRARGRP